VSARGTVERLPVRHPIGFALPAMFHDDSFAQRWCSGLDEVLAPVPAALDSFVAYLDPQLAPVDFVEWLGGWVGLDIDHTWPEERRRQLIGRAAQLYAWRGTARGLADLIEIYLGVRPTIEDGCTGVWSETPGVDLPGADDPVIVVRIEVDDPSSIDETRLSNMVTRNKPAHLAHRVEIVGRGTNS
jgi:phage tail-like protein